METTLQVQRGGVAGSTSGTWASIQGMSVKNMFNKIVGEIRWVGTDGI